MKLDWSAEVDAIHNNSKNKRDIINKLEVQFEQCMKALGAGEGIVLIFSKNFRVEALPLNEIGVNNTLTVINGVDELLEFNRLSKKLHETEQKIRDALKDNPKGLSLLDEYIKVVTEDQLYCVQIVVTEDGIDNVYKSYSKIHYIMVRRYIVGLLHAIGILFS